MRTNCTISIVAMVLCGFLLLFFVLLSAGSSQKNRQQSLDKKESTESKESQPRRLWYPKVVV